MLIENEHLILRTLTANELEMLTCLVSSDTVYRYEPTFLAERQYAPEKAIEVLSRLDLEKDRQCILGIFLKKDPDTMVGLAELYDYKTNGKTISIGYRLSEKYWGQGIATLTVNTLINYLLKNTRVTVVTAHVIPDNAASAGVLTKNGFRLALTKEEDWGFEHLTKADVYTLDLIPEKIHRVTDAIAAAFAGLRPHLFPNHRRS